AAPGEEQESAPRDLGRAVEVEQTEPGRDLPVRLGHPVEGARGAPRAHHLVLRGVATGRYRGVRQIGDPGGERLALLLELLELGIHRLDALAHLPHRGDLGVRRLTAPLAGRDLLARRVAPRLELLALVQELEAALLDAVEAAEVHAHPLE